MYLTFLGISFTFPNPLWSEELIAAKWGKWAELHEYALSTVKSWFVCTFLF